MVSWWRSSNVPRYVSLLPHPLHTLAAPMPSTTPLHSLLPMCHSPHSPAHPCCPRAIYHTALHFDAEGNVH